MVGRAVVVVAQRDAERGAAVAVELICRGLAGAAAHKAALHGELRIVRDAEEGRGFVRVEDRGLVADAHDHAVAHLALAAALGAGLERDDRHVLRHAPALREMDRADEADLFRPREEPVASALDRARLQLVKHRDDGGAPDEVVARPRVDALVLQDKGRQIPHRERAEIAHRRPRIEIARGHAAEEFLADIRRVIHVRGEGVARQLLPALVVRDHVPEVVLLHAHMRTLRELHEDLAAHGVLVERGGRLGKQRAGNGEEAVGFHSGGSVCHRLAGL